MQKVKELLDDASLDDNDRQAQIAELKAEYAGGGTGRRSAARAYDYVETYANEWLEFAIVTEPQNSNSGKFTFGTKEGNPNYTSDNNQLLLFGHPSPWSSATYIYVKKPSSNEEKMVFFKADNVRVDSNRGEAYADMYLEEYGVSVTQKIEFIEDSRSGRKDTAKISYMVNNDSAVDVEVGIRIMMDTMLASNDAATFRISGEGNLLKEKEFVGSDIPRTYMVYDNLDNPTTYAMGTLWMAGERKPDKVQFCYWPSISGYSAWDYTPAERPFGDSAVTIYFNPKRLVSGSGTTVSTYYGTNLTAIDSTGSNESDIDVSAPLKSDEFAVIAMDYSERKCLEGVKITANGQEKTTDKKGRAVFSAGSIADNTNLKIKLEMSGYKTIEVEKIVSKGRTVCVYMKKTGDMVPLVTSATMTSSSANPKYHNKDLIAQQVYFNANKSNVNPDVSNRETLTIKVTSDTENCVYKLMKDDDLIEANDTGVFKLESVTKDNSGKNFNVNRICGIDEGQNISVRVVSAEGIESAKTLLGIKVSLPSTFASTILDKVEFAGKIKFDLPDEDIMRLLLGDDQYEAGPDLLPIEIEYDQDGKIKVSINGDKDKTWLEKEEEYQKAVLQRSNAAQAFGGSPVNFGSGQAKMEMSVSGYGEGWLENGQINVNVGIVLSAKGEASYTRTFFVGWVPLYIKVGAEIGAEGTFEASVIKETNVKLNITQGEFKPSVALYAELGAGASGLLSAGVQGRGTLAYSANFANKHYMVTLEAKASIEAHAVLFHKSINIAQRTWILYDSNNPRSASEVSEYANVLSDMYDIDSYELTPRDYLDTGSSGSDFDGVYVDSKPVVVYANGKPYRFWIRDNESRKIMDRAELVYSVKTGNLWSNATPVMNAADGQSDYNFDVFVDGDKIHIAWQHSNKKFEGSSATADTLNDMIKSSEIYYAVLDTANNNAISASERLTDDNKGDLAPKVAISGGKPIVAWYTNENNIIVSNGSDSIGNSTIHYKEKTEAAWSDAKSVGVGRTLVTNMDIGMLDNEVQIAYSMDTDGKLGTIADRELYLVKGLADAQASQAKVTPETYNASMDENPRFATIGGKNVLVWYQDNNIMYTDKTPSEAVKIFGDNNPAPNNLNSEFTVVDGTSPYVFWTGISQDSPTGINERYKMSIYAAKKEANGWSNAFEWEKIDGNEPVISYLSGYQTADQTSVQYAIAQYGTDGSVVTSEIRETSGTARTAIELVSYDYNENDTESGKPIAMKLTLRNSGNTTISNPTVNIGGVETQLTINLPAGSTVNTVANVTLPTFSAAGELNMKVTSGSAESETKKIYAGYTDIAAELGDRSMLADKEYVTLVITNKSRTKAENVNVKILADDVNAGAIVFDHSLREGIDPGSSYTLLCPLDRLADTKVGYIRISTTTSERNKMNNETLIVLDTELPDMVDTFLFTIASDNDEAGTIVGSYLGSYETNAPITVKAQPKPGFRFSHWESSADGTFENPQASETVFVMPADNVTVKAYFVSETLGLTAVALSPNPLELGVGEEYQLTVTVTPSGIGVKNEDLQWTSSAPNIVTVDYKGRVAAKAVGEADITAKFNDSIRASCRIKVGEVQAERIRFIYPAVTLSGIGTTQKLELMVVPQGATSRISYSVEDTTVLDIDDDGVVKSLKRGTSRVFATATSRSGAELKTECSVTVVDPITGIEISSNILNMEVGEEEELGIMLTPLNPTNTDEIKWESSDERIVKVQPRENKKSAVVTAVSSGTAYVNVSAGNISRSCRIVVNMQQTQAVMLKNVEYTFKNERELVAKFELDMDACGYVDLSTITFKLYSDEESDYIAGNPSVSVNVADKSVLVTYYSADTRPEFEQSYYISARNGSMPESVRTKIVIYGYQPFNVAKIPDQIYTGEAIKPDVQVSFNGSPLTKGIDYELAYDTSPVSAGSHYITITGMWGSPISGKSCKVRYNICYDLSKCNIKFTDKSYYTGEPVTANFQVTRDVYKMVGRRRRKVAEPIQTYYYEAVYSNNIALGTASLTVIGKSDSSGVRYATGVKSATFKIEKPDLKKVATISTIPAQPYTGSAIKPAITVSYWRTGTQVRLQEGIDYTVSYSNNIKLSVLAAPGRRAKLATVKVKGKGAYTGSTERTFIISQRNIGSLEDGPLAGISVTVGDNDTAVYNNGQQLKPKVVVKDNGRTLRQGADYTLTYGTNTGPAGTTGTVVIKAKGSYSGEIRKDFKVVEGTVGAYTITLNEDKFTYDGMPHKPQVTVKKGNETLREDVDFEAYYKNFINVGKATVEVRGISSKFGGSKSKQYTIQPKNVSNSDSGVEIRVSNQNYTGNPVMPEVIVKDGSRTVNPSDYQVSYSSNTRVTDSAKVTVKFKGNYRGQKTAQFKITSWALKEDTTVVEIGSAVYAGKDKAVTPAVTVMDSESGAVLKQGTAYTVEFSDNKSAGLATVKIKPKNMGAGSAEFTKSFTIKKAYISDAQVGKIAPYTYDGSAAVPNVTVKYGKETLTQGTDYKVVYRNNVIKGKACADIVGMGNFRGTYTVNFAIK